MSKLTLADGYVCHLTKTTHALNRSVGIKSTRNDASQIAKLHGLSNTFFLCATWPGLPPCIHYLAARWVVGRLLPCLEPRFILA